jgi:uncharacterized protein (DUF1697 family)
MTTRSSDSNDRFVALYRGINVGGHNLVAMAALRAMHGRLGHSGVASYIQSGNVVFSAEGRSKATAHAIAAAFREEFGFAARVLVVPAARWRALAGENPYAKPAAKDPKTVHAAICEGAPSAPGLKALLAKTGGRESFTVKNGVIFLHTPDGVGSSKFAAGIEKACGVPATIRNWRTIEAILAMLDRG